MTLTAILEAICASYEISVAIEYQSANSLRVCESCSGRE